MPAFADRFRVRAPISILKESDRKQIHDAGLEVIETVGLRVHSKVARDSLRKAGAEVNDKSMIVKIPADLTESLISKAPSDIILAGRDKEFDLPLDGRHCYFTTDGCGTQVWDQKTRTRRLSVLRDIIDTAIISDWLPHLSIYEPMVVPSDIPQEMHVVTSIRESFRITRKHINSESTSRAEEARFQIKMASEIVGGLDELRRRHIMSAMVCTMSPLTLDGHGTDAAMVWGDANVPVHITGMAMMGVSSPATVPGNLVVNHAETLTLAAAMQAHSPGSPVIYGSVLSNMDPRTGAIQLASPEALILGTAAADMARYVKMPSYGAVNSNAKIPGMQSGLENGMLVLANVLSGREINNGIGLMDCSTVLSYEQMIVDDDIVGRALTAACEIPVTRDSLHLDMIKDVGILGIGSKKGSYLAERATAAEARGFFQSLIFDSEPFEQWKAKGGKDDLTLAKERADWILKNHEPVMLDKDISRRLDEIVKSAAKA